MMSKLILLFILLIVSPTYGDAEKDCAYFLPTFQDTWVGVHQLWWHHKRGQAIPISKEELIRKTIAAAQTNLRDEYGLTSEVLSGKDGQELIVPLNGRRHVISIELLKKNYFRSALDFFNKVNSIYLESFLQEAQKNQFGFQLEFMEIEILYQNLLENSEKFAKTSEENIEARLKILLENAYIVAEIYKRAGIEMKVIAQYDGYVLRWKNISQLSIKAQNKIREIENNLNTQTFIGVPELTLDPSGSEANYDHYFHSIRINPLFDPHFLNKNESNFHEQLNVWLMTMNHEKNHAGSGLKNSVSLRGHFKTTSGLPEDANAYKKIFTLDEIGAQIHDGFIFEGKVELIHWMLDTFEVALRKITKAIESSSNAVEFDSKNGELDMKVKIEKFNIEGTIVIGLSDLMALNPQGNFEKLGLERASALKLQVAQYRNELIEYEKALSKP